MGCDIHIVIQRQEADGQWAEIAYQDAPNDWNKRPLTPNVAVAPDGFDGRNYDLFGILADVRNGSGFAGVLTGSGWPSIAPRRGLPKGFDEAQILPSPEYPEYSRGVGDHSFTWIGLEELKAFDWDGVKALKFGVIPAAEYERLSVNNDRPTEWSGGISGPGIQVYEPAEYHSRKGNGLLCEHPYVRMSWVRSAREATGDWSTTVLPWLEKLADGKPLRLVMGFDS